MRGLGCHSFRRPGITNFLENGGSLETVRGGESSPTGSYFYEQTPEAAAKAIMNWESEGEARFQPAFAREWAAKFATPVFLERYREFVLRHVPQAASAAASVAQAADAVRA